MTHIKQQKLISSTQGLWICGYNKTAYYIHGPKLMKIISAILYVSLLLSNGRFLKNIYNKTKRFITMFLLHRVMCEMLVAKALKGCQKNANGVYLWLGNVRVKNPKLFANSGSKAKCINIFPQRGYRWNDEPCTVPMCFVCK